MVIPTAIPIVTTFKLSKLATLRILTAVVALQPFGEQFADTSVILSTKCKQWPSTKIWVPQIHSLSGPPFPYNTSIAWTGYELGPGHGHVKAPPPVLHKSKTLE